MNTRLFKLAVISAIVMGAAAAHAGPPVSQLTVAGKVTAPACQVSPPNGGAYNFGKIGTAMVKAGTTTNTLPAITQSWLVNCDAPTYLSFNVIDNRAATSSASTKTTGFGLGPVNGTGKIGYYNVTMSLPTVDGKKAYTYGTAGTTFSIANSVNIDNTLKHGWATSDNVQTAGMVFGADMQVTPTLAGTTTMNGPVTEDTDLDGSLTLNFAFGL